MIYTHREWQNLAKQYAIFSKFPDCFSVLIHHAAKWGDFVTPSQLFGKCTCVCCNVQKRRGGCRPHCIECGRCAFLIVPRTMDLVASDESFTVLGYRCNVKPTMCWNHRQLSCSQMIHATQRFMLWLCWTHLRSAQAGLGKLPRVLIKIISNLMC